MSALHFETAVSELIWQQKYRALEASGAPESSIADSWRRVARAIARVEADDQAGWEERFYQLLDNFQFLPGGRILAGAGSARQVTLFNCFVMGVIEDSLDGIFDALKEGARTMQQGGGVGYDFSTLRPSGMAARTVGSTASGPVSFMHIWDAMCATLISAGNRRGAMMATLRCDHPDIDAFVEAKRDPARLRNFNVSVLVSDAFMQAVEADAEWSLVFPERSVSGAGPLVERRWSGAQEPERCRVVKTVKARELWTGITRAAYDCAEPGVLFIDRINQLNNLGWCEHISATNPCGEIPLPPYGACDLGSLNLTRFVHDSFAPKAWLDFPALTEAAAQAVRLLDNVIDASRYPLPAQASEAHAKRRIGLGVTGLADALIMLGLHYGSEEARQLAADILRTLRDAAYGASVELAREKGPFPGLRKEAYLATPFIRSLPAALRAAIATHGIRNSHLLAIAPTGTISLLANNVSSGIEPLPAAGYERRIRGLDGRLSSHTLEAMSVRLWRANQAGLPTALVTVDELKPQDHLAMQAAIQPFVDNAISKTINGPAAMSFAEFQDVYAQAWRLGLKGVTVFRPNPVTGAIISGTSEPGAPCCEVGREPE
ncbi:MAG TPA: adenosylcobalamin-dependent ribonucleoside-diphosphate reductase [Thiobacillaceae bacterium]|nr:adenosylcobalamin-dependent ribonucleoside-diphosphate reductase [Thiobacillaceae bacterium]